MQITTMGLVLRATKTGENDRILAILTPEYGVVSAVAKGSQRLKNKLFSATGLFCYSEFVLFPGKNLYTVDDAQEREEGAANHPPPAATTAAGGSGLLLLVEDLVVKHIESLGRASGSALGIGRFGAWR